MANTNVLRNPSSAGSSEVGTLSVWTKRAKVTNGHQNIITFDQSGTYFEVYYKATDEIQVYATSHTNADLTTKRKFKDTNAWYHVVLAIDSTQSTASNRLKLYINGEQITDFFTATYPGQGNNMYINRGSGTINVGSLGSSNYYTGSMSHFHWIDGTAYDASAFGETDATTGEWKIKANVSVTYGTNGFFILKDGNSVTDQSGNSNNFTVASGTLTKTLDCPSNVFATLNPLLYESRDNTFSNGNNTVTNAGSNDWSNHYGSSTLAMSSGKWYVESKVVTRVGSQAPLGIISTTEVINSSLQDDGRGAVISSGEIAVYGSVVQSGLTTIASGDIIGAAFDATNGTLQFYRNGSTYGSQLTSIPSGEYYFTCNSYDGGQIAFNFGNGYFSTTAVATNSGNGYAGAEGSSIFNYQPPTGYKALSTKGLNL